MEEVEPVNEEIHTPIKDDEMHRSKSNKHIRTRSIDSSITRNVSHPDLRDHNNGSVDQEASDDANSIVARTLELNTMAIEAMALGDVKVAVDYISKAEQLLEMAATNGETIDRNLIIVTLYNCACFYHKGGSIDDCASYLEACIFHLNYRPQSANGKPPSEADKFADLKKLRHQFKIHLQLCAILSQLNKHENALYHAQLGLKLAQRAIFDTYKIANDFLLKRVVRKRTPSEGKKRPTSMHRPKRSLDSASLESISILEDSTSDLIPTLEDIMQRINDNSVEDVKYQVRKKAEQLLKNKEYKLNMRSLLGVVPQNDWIFGLNIGNIMQINPLTWNEFKTPGTRLAEITRDAMLEKLCLLVAAYFCIATELRFLHQSNAEVAAWLSQDEQFWHAKAVEISCAYLPNECPLVNHVLTSYQRHHPESESESDSDPNDNPSTTQEQKLFKKVPSKSRGVRRSNSRSGLRQGSSENLSVEDLSSAATTASSSTKSHHRPTGTRSQLSAASTRSRKILSDSKFVKKMMNQQVQNIDGRDVEHQEEHHQSHQQRQATYKGMRQKKNMNSLNDNILLSYLDAKRALDQRNLNIGRSSKAPIRAHHHPHRSAAGSGGAAGGSSDISKSGLRRRFDVRKYETGVRPHSSTGSTSSASVAKISKSPSRSRLKNSRSVSAIITRNNSSPIQERESHATTKKDAHKSGGGRSSSTVKTRYGHKRSASWSKLNNGRSNILLTE